MYNAPNGPGGPGGPRVQKLTAPELSARKQASGSDAIAMVTAYDFTMARLLDEAGVDMVLVGDSLGMVVQGLANTIPVTMDEMIYHTRAVARGLARAHLVGDLPFLSYQVSPAQAVESAGRLMKEGFAESVKLEGGIEVAEHVHRIVRSGIPVVGHVGLTPQSVHALGGFKVQGRGDDAADKVLADALAIERAGAFAIVLEAVPPDVAARAIERAGAFAIVLEAVPPDVAARISAEIGVPTIGIGAGAACDGQVLVCTDLLGMLRGHSPKFAKQYAQLGDAIVGAVRSYVDEVQAGTFPGPEHQYKPNHVPGDSAPEMPRLEEVPAVDLRH
jgi:3-methyl-2-oxobutanoate hydroxymethyltransferase